VCVTTTRVSVLLFINFYSDALRCGTHCKIFTNHSAININLSTVKSINFEQTVNH